MYDTIDKQNIEQNKEHVVWSSKEAVFAVAELLRQFEFSAERFSENAKTIKITLFTELFTVISLNYVQSLLYFLIKTFKNSIFSTKMPVDTKLFLF